MALHRLMALEIGVPDPAALAAHGGHGVPHVPEQGRKLYELTHSFQTQESLRELFSQVPAVHEIEHDLEVLISSWQHRWLF